MHPDFNQALQKKIKQPEPILALKKQKGPLDGIVRPPKLGMGPVAHRADYGDARWGCCDDGLRVDEHTVPTGTPKP
jgi:hypothetical protein